MMEASGTEDLASTVAQLDERISREGASVRIYTSTFSWKDGRIDWDPGAQSRQRPEGFHKEIRLVANKQGLLRLGVECLKAALAPAEDPEKRPGLVNNVKTDWTYMLTASRDTSCYASVGRFETTPDWVQRFDDEEKGRRRTGWIALVFWSIVAALSIVGLVSVWRVLFPMP